jgi:hypothetical protein
VKRKATVPPVISRAIRGFALPREVMLDLLWEIHEVLPREYDPANVRRTNDLAGYLHRVQIKDDFGNDYFFVFVVNDSTSPDHLIIAQVGFHVV